MIQEIEGEQIIRKVSAVGNGAHVFAPREWLGNDVIMVRKPQKSVDEKILGLILPYLKDIKGVYLYGSYARGEAREDSDIDILVIANKKLKIKKKGYEIVVLQEEDITKAIKIAPVLIYSALAEAQPIINSELLNVLRKKYCPLAADFKEYVSETKKIISINEELLDAYSIILRLRGIYIINLLIKGESYSNKKFTSWLSKILLGVDVVSLYENYRKRKKNGKSEDVSERHLRLALELLKNKTLELDKRIRRNGKKKKAA